MAKAEVKKLYNSKAWKQQREYILKRDSFICKQCGSVAEEVHHLKHVTVSNVNDVNVTLNEKNLISLCRDCHCRLHDKDRTTADTNITDEKQNFSFNSEGQLVPISPPCDEVECRR